MARINLNGMLNTLRERKYRKLFELKPFLRLCGVERDWWRDYFKLKACGELLGVPNIPKLRNGPLLDHPWFDPTHTLNNELGEYGKVVNKSGCEWQTHEDYVVRVVFCERHPSEGCEGCSCEHYCQLQ